ncbi:hypothetical protein H4S01_004412 [Coemansia sp. RSA 2610]|nr:hypothetical protein H4S01_004412 [Coemansia sp. RSA 2610]
MFSAQADTASLAADPAMSAAAGANVNVIANVNTDANTSTATAEPSASAAKEAASAAGSKASAKSGHRKRARATSEQVSVLENVYSVNRSPASRMREDLAASLGMAPRQVQVWFQNRRAKEKLQQKNSRVPQNPSSVLYDQLAFANISPDIYSMAMASSFMPVGADSNAATAAAGNPGFIGNPAALGFGHSAPLPISHTMSQQQQQHAQLFESQMALAAAAAAASSGAAPPAIPAGANPWLNWNVDMARQTQGLPPHALHMVLPGGLGHMPPAIDSTSKPETTKAGFGLTVAAAAPLYAANICDSRRESEISGITAVASPIGLGPTASESTGTTVSSAASPATTPAAATALAVATPDLAVTATPGSALTMQTDATMAPDLSTLPPCAANGNVTELRPGGAARRPAPLALAPHQMAGASAVAAAGMGPQIALGYPGYIPEIPSYMVLDAARLTVGAWHRVPKPDTELTCLACVEPPPPKPVQRPGNHRPTELDFLVGEFQWIISSDGMRYKMVLPYSTISRINFREVPDPAAGLVDPASDSVLNPQAALLMLSQALKNPQARGELSIHVYDTPLFFFQTDSDDWREIGDFSMDRSASATKVHTISGPFMTLFCQLRVLLATCSRLKVAADPLMALWLGNMDDPYSAVASLPHNAWLPCAGAVRLHAAHRGSAPAESGTPATDEATAPPPASAAPSGISTLTPTPTSAGFSHASLGSAQAAAFALGEAAMPYHSSLAAALASGVGHDAGAIKTQRSASLPFIQPTPGRPGSSALKVGGNSLQTSSDGVGLGISNTPPPGAALPLRHRTSCNHLRRPAPYTVGQPAASPHVNSPQASPLPPWCAGIRRASRDSLPGGFARRESDVELALAMNSAFASGDMLGAHRGLGEVCGTAAVPPSPLSNVAISAAMHVDPAAAERSSGAPEGLTSSAGAADAFLLPPNDAYGPTSKVESAIAELEGSGALSANMMLAIFNAMAAAPNGSGAPALSATTAIDPATLAFDPSMLLGPKGSANPWPDWTQAAGGTQALLAPELPAPSETPGSGDDMHIDCHGDEAGAQR